MLILVYIHTYIRRILPSHCCEVRSQVCQTPVRDYVVSSSGSIDVLPYMQRKINPHTKSSDPTTNARSVSMRPLIQCSHLVVT